MIRAKRWRGRTGREEERWVEVQKGCSANSDQQVSHKPTPASGTLKSINQTFTRLIILE